MRLGSPDEVVTAAEAVILKLQKVYQEPTRSLREFHIFAKDGDADPLLDFSKASREDLAGLLR
jgi:hypothetical protein